MAAQSVEIPRYWNPEGSRPTLEPSGFLTNPEGQYSVDSDARTLASLADRPVVVLLGDPGLGKTSALRQERDRLAGAGESAVLIDLPDHGSWEDVQTEIESCEDFQHWKADGTGPFTLLLDGFDELTFSHTNCRFGLSKYLQSFKHSPPNLRVTARHGMKASGLNSYLDAQLTPGSSTWILAPLTIEAARSIAEGVAPGHGEEIIAAAVEQGIGPIAAIPLTLTMLASVHKNDGALPESRGTTYALGISELLREHNKDRRAEKPHPIPIAELFAAAGRLAALTLLTGRPRILRRQSSSSAKTLLALDDPRHEGITIDVLDAVFDSALMASLKHDTAAFAHRSFAEFLAAQHLESLPLETITHLLQDPQGSGEVVPYLEGVAIWLSETNSKIFDWLAGTQPDLLLGPTLAAFPADAQKTICRALIGQAVEGLPALDWRSYRGLSYPDLTSDLRSLLKVDGDSRTKSLAISIVSHNNIRELDTELLDLVQAAVSESGSEYNQTKRFGVGAAFALTGLTNQHHRAALSKIVTDPAIDPYLREAALSAVEDNLDARALLESLNSTDVPLNERRLTDSIFEIVESEITADPDLIIDVANWVTANDLMHPFDEFAMSTITKAAEGDYELTPEILESLCSIAAHLIVTTDVPGNQQSNSIANPKRRRTIADAILQTSDSPVEAHDLKNLGLLDDEDFEHWMATLANLASEDEPAARVEAVVVSLARPDAATKAIATELVRTYPILKALSSDLFSDSRMEDRADSERKRQEAQDAAEAEAQDRLFSKTRATSILQNQSWPELAQELQKPLTLQQDPGPSAEILIEGGWTKLATDQQKAATDLARDFLTKPEPVDHYLQTDASVHAITLLTALEPEALAAVPAAALKTWAPRLIESPASHDQTNSVLKHLTQTDQFFVEELIITQLRDQAQDEYPNAVYLVDACPSDRVGQELVQLISDSDTGAEATGTFTELALALDPTAALQAARTTVEAAMPGLSSEARTTSLVTSSHMVDPNSKSWKRASYTIRAVASSASLNEAFDLIISAFEASTDFAISVIRKDHLSPTQSIAFSRLNPQHAAKLYHWALNSLPRPPEISPGVPITPDPAAEFADKILRRLRYEPSEGDLGALQSIAAQLEQDHDPDAIWVRAYAKQAALEIRGGTWTPATPQEISAVLGSPSQRLANTNEQLADAVVIAIDKISEQIRTDTSIRSMFWHRQTGGDGQRAKYETFSACDENEFSDRFGKLLQRELEGTMVKREVQLQPRLGSQTGQRLDFEVTVTSGGKLVAACIVEVKKDSNSELKTSPTRQLANRYLEGPLGKSGVYLVAGYGADQQKLDGGLEQQCSDLNAKGFYIQYRRVDLTPNPSKTE